jgi:Spy/CpxP family protein refolding chaperone
VLKSKLLMIAAALAVIAVFAMQFAAIKSSDSGDMKCAMTPMGGSPGTYAVSCTNSHP